MTREEAIKIINCYDIGFYDLSEAKITADKLADAFDMAIEALQREDEFLKNLESNEPQFYDEDDYWNGRVPTHGRLIDADALKETMKNAVVKHICTNTLYNTIMAVIDGAPTVQADRPHGEWVKMPNGNIECSECRHQKGWYENFCGFCGADMRKEKK